MFKKDAEERITEQYGTSGEYITRQRIWQQGAEFGYNKANEWHNVKDGDLPKEEKQYLVYSEEWGYEIRKFLVDVGYFECRKNDNIIKWKEIE